MRSRQTYLKTEIYFLSFFFFLSFFLFPFLWFYALNKSALGETDFEHSLVLTSCSTLQFFNFSSIPWHGQSGHTCHPAIHCASLAWITECYAAPLVTKYFSPNPYLGKQRISLINKSPKDVPLSTCLYYLQPNSVIWYVLFMC